MFEDGTFTHKLDYVTFLEEIINPEGLPKCITGSKVTAILLNGWILPVVGVVSGRVCAQPAKQACLYMPLFPNTLLYSFPSLQHPTFQLHKNTTPNFTTT